MQERPPSFFGSVLKAVACTPNRNSDAKAYEEGVLKPVGRIREIAEAAGDAPPTDEEVREVVSLLLTSFQTKMLAEGEQASRLLEILELHHLTSMFPDLLRSPEH